MVLQNHHDSDVNIRSRDTQNEFDLCRILAHFQYLSMNIAKVNTITVMMFYVENITENKVSNV